MSQESFVSSGLVSGNSQKNKFFIAVDKGICHEILHRLLEKAERKVDIAIFKFSK